MAARGLFRLSNRLHVGNGDVKSVKICIHRKKTTLDTNIPVTPTSWNVMQVCVSSSEVTQHRNYHTVCSEKSYGKCVGLKPKHLSIVRYHLRSIKTSESIEVDEDNEDSEEIGAFEKYDLSEVTQNKLRKLGINHLFPVQYNTYKPTIEGNDVIVQARTGTGKTLSFALPVVEKLQRDPSRFHTRNRKPRVIVLAPTRELANQVKSVFSQLSDTVAVTCCYGGASITPQIQALRNGVDVVVGTPGRVMDLMDRRELDLSDVQHVILDEVDEMLNMGFEEDVDTILRDCYTHGDKPQTMLYSATVPRWVHSTAKKYLSDNYKMISLVGKMTEQTATTVKQYAVMCKPIQQPTVIKDLVKLYTEKDGRAIVFCQTKKEANDLSSTVLGKDANVLHGDISASLRPRILEGFKKGAFKVLVTTDVAARGLDIPDVDLVIQAQPPSNVNYYIHRVGRTGRAGKSGTSILLYQKGEQDALLECERAAKVRFERMGIPTLEQLRQLCIKDAVTDILKVPEASRKMFEQAAQMLINEKGAVSSLAAAMAIVSHAETYQNRSLITCEEGYNTLIYKMDRRARMLENARDKVFTYLKGLNIHMKNFHDLADRSGVVFDVKSSEVESALASFDDVKDDDGETLSTCDVLPNIMEQGRGHTFSHSSRNRPNKRQPRHRFKYDDDDDDEELFGSSFTPKNVLHRGQYRRNSGHNNYNNKRYDRNNNSFPGSRYDEFRPSNRSNYSNSRKNTQRSEKDYMYEDVD